MPHESANPGGGDAGVRQEFSKQTADNSRSFYVGQGSARSWRDALPIHPTTELLPRMSPDELRVLAEDILERGLDIPITVWRAQEHFPPQSIDGRNRLDAMQAVSFTLKVENVGPTPIRGFGCGYGSRRSTCRCRWRPSRCAAIDPTAIRTPTSSAPTSTAATPSRRELIGKLIKVQPERSNRQIAKTVGCAMSALIRSRHPEGRLTLTPRQRRSQ
jgi:hypothetical protein